MLAIASVVPNGSVFVPWAIVLTLVPSQTGSLGAGYPLRVLLLADSGVASGPGGRGKFRGGVGL